MSYIFLFKFYKIKYYWSNFLFRVLYFNLRDQFSIVGSSSTGHRSAAALSSCHARPAARAKSVGSGLVKRIARRRKLTGWTAAQARIRASLRSRPLLLPTRRIAAPRRGEHETGPAKPSAPAPGRTEHRVCEEASAIKRTSTATLPLVFVLSGGGDSLGSLLCGAGGRGVLIASFVSLSVRHWPLACAATGIPFSSSSSSSSSVWRGRGFWWLPFTRSLLFKNVKGFHGKYGYGRGGCSGVSVRAVPSADPSFHKIRFVSLRWKIVSLIVIRDSVWFLFSLIAWSYRYKIRSRLLGSLRFRLYLSPWFGEWDHGFYEMH